MSLLERLFGRIHKRLTKRAKPEGVSLTELAPELTVWAAAIGGEAIALESVDFGGRGLLLPTHAATRDVFLYRILYALTVRSLGYVCCTADPVLEALLVVPLVEAHIDAAWPGAAALRAKAARVLLAKPARPGSVALIARVLLGEASTAAHAAFVLAQRAGPSALAQLEMLLPRDQQRGEPELALWGLLPVARNDVPALSDVGAFDAQALPRGTEKSAHIKGKVQHLQQAPKEDEQLPVFHVFEKLKTSEDYGGGNRPLDGSDEMDEQADSLDALNMNTIVRTQERAESLLRVDGLGDMVAPELASEQDVGERLVYPEWDEKRRMHKPAWCSLFCATAKAASPDITAAFVARWMQTHALQVARLRRDMARIVTERRQRSFQSDGETLDSDAVLDAMVDRVARVTPSEKLYQSRPKRVRDVATLFLMDNSLSSDGWVENQRVLDVAREAVWMIAAALEEQGAKTAVAAFHSHTRRDCRYLTLKAFDAPWTHLSARLAALEPTAYTRIGPALRHATSVLAKAPARQRLLVLLSDGKPTDYDRYEGDYGVADVRQAVLEARAQGVHVKVLAITATAKRQLPQMFDDYQFLPHPRLLPEALVRIYRELAR